MFDRLSEDQLQVLNIVREGHNIFITGQDGTARKNNYLLSSIFLAGEGGFGQMMYRSPEGHLRTPRMEFFCTVPRPYFLGRALIWPGCFGEHIEEEEPLLIYTAQGSPFRRKKLSVINGSPEQQRTKTTLNI